ncbi:MAG: hypothetical protein Q7J03_01210 [Methanoregula sp.]|nr:hypothetical protein [Methanoregula sp.]
MVVNSGVGIIVGIIVGNGVYVTAGVGVVVNSPEDFDPAVSSGIPTKYTAAIITRITTIPPIIIGVDGFFEGTEVIPAGGGVLTVISGTGEVADTGEVAGTADGS